MQLNKDKIGIVIPYYNASKHIENVVKKAAFYSNAIVIVNDCSKEPLPKSVVEDSSLVILNNDKNLGVGGASVKGFEELKKRADIELMIKLDSDDQMDTRFIPEMIESIQLGYGFVKGNRFRDFKQLKKMPAVRRFGNFFLSFLSKVATGYWNIFDFNNGFFAISKKTYATIDSSNLKASYFFETSLIAELYFYKIPIKEIAMPAIYGNEKSNMKITKMPALFLKNLFKLFISRLIKSYYIYDFSIGTIYMLFSFLFLTTGIAYGGYNWYVYASQGILTPLGTIMISTLLIILGFQLLLQFIQYDILNTPKNDK